MSSVPRPEYPRPDFVRKDWINLNGEWEFAFDDAEVGIQEHWFGPEHSLGARITVPFAYQTELSGIWDPTIHEVVWYARSFEVPDAWLRAGDILLHFGAVDYRCRVWVNGRDVGGNAGGHVPFEFNICPYLLAGKNRVVVRVEDRQDRDQPRGKQSSSGKAEGIDYICTTGIWQTVWLESAPALRVANLRVATHAGTDPSQDSMDLRVGLHAPWGSYRLTLDVLHEGNLLSHAEQECETSVASLHVALPLAPRWSPENPNLLDLTLRLFQGDLLLDEVQTYAGLRTIGARDGKVTLNGEPIYLQMVLDQGYWPESLITPPSDEAICLDIELTKAMGFNGARKHQKVEDPRWLYWCDRLGLLVWGEMANAREWSDSAVDAFQAEWERVVLRDLNHPCIIAWVPINESWGVPSLEEQPAQVAFVERVVEITRLLDSTRPVIDNDGWEHTDVGDIAAIHDYTPDGNDLVRRWQGGIPARTWGRGRLAHYVGDAQYRGQPIVLSEVGGFLLIPEGKSIAEMDRLYSVYDTHRTSEELLKKYRALMDGIRSLAHVAGYCYTQLTDIAPEMNGLLTADRRPKVSTNLIRAANRES